MRLLFLICFFGFVEVLCRLWVAVLRKICCVAIEFDVWRLIFLAVIYEIYIKY